MKTMLKTKVFGLREIGRYILCLRAAHVHGVHVEKTIEVLLISLARALVLPNLARLTFVPGITCHSFCLKFLRTKFLQ